MEARRRSASSTSAPEDDGGYNQAAYQGELAVKKMANVETIKAENVPENAEAERVMEQMIAQGAKIIFPTSFGHLDPAMKVAAKHPDVAFIHEGGLKSSANVGTFFGTIWQTEYLAGMAAGSASKSGKLGFVVAFPISQTLLNINAFQLGAKSVNPRRDHHRGVHRQLVRPGQERRGDQEPAEPGHRRDHAAPGLPGAGDPGG